MIVVGSLAESVNLPKLEYLGILEISYNSKLVDIDIKKGAEIGRMWIKFNNKLTGAVLKKTENYSTNIREMQEEGGKKRENFMFLTILLSRL